MQRFKSYQDVISNQSISDKNILSLWDDRIKQRLKAISNHVTYNLI